MKSSLFTRKLGQLAALSKRKNRHLLVKVILILILIRRLNCVYLTKPLSPLSLRQHTFTLHSLRRRTGRSLLLPLLPHCFRCSLTQTAQTLSPNVTYVRNIFFVVVFFFFNGSCPLDSDRYTRTSWSSFGSYHPSFPLIRWPKHLSRSKQLPLRNSASLLFQHL